MVLQFKNYVCKLSIPNLNIFETQTGPRHFWEERGTRIVSYVFALCFVRLVLPNRKTDARKVPSVSCVYIVEVMLYWNFTTITTIQNQSKYLQSEKILFRSELLPFFVVDLRYYSDKALCTLKTLIVANCFHNRKTLTSIHSARQHSRFLY